MEEGRNYTEKEVMELLQNSEKAEQFKREHATMQTTIGNETKPLSDEKPVAMFVKDEQNPQYQTVTNIEALQESTFDNGFSDITEEEYNQMLKDPFTNYQTDEDAKRYFDNYLKKKGEQPKLNKQEREILEVCAQPNFMDMLREEFARNPIDYEQAEKERGAALFEQFHQ